MDRMSRLFAALRLVLVAVTVCLLGAATRLEHTRPTATAAVTEAHADSVRLPGPSPAVAEPRDEDPRSGAEDDAVAHGPRAHLTSLAAPTPRAHPVRGPPPGHHRAPWRPRSSRGPPALV